MQPMAMAMPCHDVSSALQIVQNVQVLWDSGGQLNIKMPSYQYRDPHVKDKTVSRPSYL